MRISGREVRGPVQLVNMITPAGEWEGVGRGGRRQKAVGSLRVLPTAHCLPLTAYRLLPTCFQPFDQFIGSARLLMAEDDGHGVGNADLHDLLGGEPEGLADDAADGVVMGNDQQISILLHQPADDGPGPGADHRQGFAPGGTAVVGVHELGEFGIVSIVGKPGKGFVVGKPLKFPMRALHELGVVGQSLEVFAMLREHQGQSLMCPLQGRSNCPAKLEISQFFQPPAGLGGLDPPEIGKVRINLSAIDSLFFIDNVKLGLAMPDHHKVFHGSHYINTWGLAHDFSWKSPADRLGGRTALQRCERARSEFASERIAERPVGDLPTVPCHTGRVLAGVTNRSRAKVWGESGMKSIRQSLVVLSCAVIIVSCSFPKLDAAEVAKRPNVILIFLDDLGWADLGCYGSTFHRSPQIDRLAKQGMRFTQAYSASPVCSPTRAALMTGKSPARLHLTNWLPGWQDARHRLQGPKTEFALPLAEVTLAEHLKAAGYATGHIGKWHLGGLGFGPRNQGFDVNIGGDHKGTPKGYFAPFYEKNSADVPHLDWAPPGSYLTDIFNDAAIRFIREHREHPFFLYLPHFAVHSPLHAKPHIVAKYKQGAMIHGQQSNPVYAAMIESVDDGVGRIVRELEKLKLSEQTILIFTSDNGGVVTADWPLFPPTINGSLREGKGHLYEGGIRVPMIVRWPKVIRPGTVCETPVTTEDFLPTILELCGVDREAIFQEQYTSQKSTRGTEKTVSTTQTVSNSTPSDISQLDGVSLVPLLKQKGDFRREALYWHYPHYAPQHNRPSGAIRVGDYKLISFFEDGRKELYNLKSDAAEMNNLVEQEPERTKELEAKLSTWQTSVGAQKMETNPLYRPNPQQTDGIVSLHVRTADIHGSSLRFQSPPHLDALSHWEQQQDWVSFDFELTKPGKFDLELLYHCLKSDAGSELEITINGQRLTHTVRATADKKFEAQNIVSLELAKPGRHTLAIKPQTKPGKIVMDLRRVRLLPAK